MPAYRRYPPLSVGQYARPTCTKPVPKGVYTSRFFHRKHPLTNTLIQTVSLRSYMQDIAFAEQ